MNWDEILSERDRLREALRAAKEKLERFRLSGPGDYVGGMEYETLMRQIRGALEE